MLLTSCPACSAQFKVQTAQLNVRQGRVMCGRCRHVFNAFETLQRVDTVIGEEFDTQTAVDVQPAPDIGAEVPTHSSPNLSASQGFIPVDISAEVKTSADCANTSPVVVAVPASQKQSSAALPTDAVPTLTHNQTDVSIPTSDRTAVAAASSADTATAIAAAAIALDAPRRASYAVDNDNLLLGTPTSAAGARVNRASRIWPWLATLAFLVLSAQVVYLYRIDLVDLYPQLRPHFANACEIVGCSLPWKRDEAVIEIADSSLIEVPGKPGRILLTATIANRSKSKQDYPVIKLELTDNNNQALVRRLLRPADYVGRPLSRDDGLAANAELYVNLSLDVDTQVRASGYGLKPIYP